jgi:hypothetical protein
MSESVWSLVRVGRASAMWVSKLSTLKGSDAMAAVVVVVDISVCIESINILDGCRHVLVVRLYGAGMCEGLGYIRQR